MEARQREERLRGEKKKVSFAVTIAPEQAERLRELLSNYMDAHEDVSTLGDALLELLSSQLGAAARVAQRRKRAA